ncbi:MAG TPA: hypothetical protein VLL75_19675 [Vicinamibacteria bacterium]|nr:hypothetical protein [Vicinamibacteria bacterium]
MKANALLPAIAALALAGLAPNRTAAAVDPSNRITIPGTVVSSQQDKLIIRTDDHGHRMTFDVGSATALPDGLRRGAHVSVTYHPLGPTGQTADEVRVVERGAFVPSQAAFKVVTGSTDDTRVGAR